MKKYLSTFIIVIIVFWASAVIALDLSALPKKNIIAVSDIKEVKGQVMLIDTQGESAGLLPHGDYKSSKNTIRVKNGTVMLIGPNGMISTLVDGVYESSVGDKIVVQDRKIISFEAMTLN